MNCLFFKMWEITKKKAGGFSDIIRKKKNVITVQEM